MKNATKIILCIIVFAISVYAGTTVNVPATTKTLDIERIAIDVNGKALGVAVELTGVDKPLYVSDAVKTYWGKILAQVFEKILRAELITQGYEVVGESTTTLDTTGVTITETTEKKVVEVDGEKVTKEYDVITITVEK